MTDETDVVSFDFEIHDTERRARCGQVEVSHGTFETPAFMPVGSNALVKGLTPRDLRETGTEIALTDANSLALSPGADTVEKMGGLHKMLGWNAPMLTVSGTTELATLPSLEVDESGLTFKYQGRNEPVQLTPEESTELQERLGADIIMALDHLVGHSCEHDDAEEAVERTKRWLNRALETHSRDDQAMFGVIHGSTFPDLRSSAVEKMFEADLPGYAIGGLGGGEEFEKMMDLVDHTVDEMPDAKPRYLMGVGQPEEIIEAVARGVDIFDCVIPSQHARTGIVFSRRGKYRLTDRDYRNDKFPLDANCGCYACRNFTRAYVRHLVKSDAPLGATLVTNHNVTFYQDLMQTIRRAIADDVFQQFRFAFLDEYLSSAKAESLGFVRLQDAYEMEAFDWETEHSCIPTTDVEANLERTDPVDTLASPEQRIEEIKNL